MTGRRLDPWKVLDRREVFSAPPFVAIQRERLGLVAFKPTAKIAMPALATHPELAEATIGRVR